MLSASVIRGNAELYQWSLILVESNVTCDCMHSAIGSLTPACSTSCSSHSKHNTPQINPNSQPISCRSKLRSGVPGRIVTWSCGLIEVARTARPAAAVLPDGRGHADEIIAAGLVRDFAQQGVVPLGELRLLGRNLHADLAGQQLLGGGRVLQLDRDNRPPAGR